MADDLERIAPGESARTRARDKKSQPPKVISVNPGLKKLALHLADKRKQKAKKKTEGGASALGQARPPSN